MSEKLDPTLQSIVDNVVASAKAFALNPTVDTKAALEVHQGILEEYLLQTSAEIDSLKGLWYKKHQRVVRETRETKKWFDLFQGLRTQFDELKKRTEHLEQYDPKLHSAGPDGNGRWTVEMSSPIVKNMAAAMIGFMGDAENYTETEVFSEGRRFIMTIQRGEGKTPHQIAQDERKKLWFISELLKEATEYASVDWSRFNSLLKPGMLFYLDEDYAHFVRLDAQIDGEDDKWQVSSWSDDEFSKTNNGWIPEKDLVSAKSFRRFNGFVPKDGQHPTPSTPSESSSRHPPRP